MTAVDFAARPAAPVGPMPAPALTRESLQLRLAQLRAGFDQAYDDSDDHVYWLEQSNRAAAIALTEQLLACVGSVDHINRPHRWPQVVSQPPLYQLRWPALLRPQSANQGATP